MLQGIWNWLNGNKTTIGSACIAIAAHVPADVEVGGVSISGVLYWVGGLLGGVGLGHKVTKKLSP